MRFFWYNRLIMIGNKAWCVNGLPKRVFAVITEEELAIFEYELIKLMDEYRRCVDQSLKLKIQEDMVWLRTAIFSISSYEETIEQ